MKQLSPEQLEEYIAVVNKLIDRFPEPRKTLVKKMFDGPIGENYFLAPASSKEEFHSCYAGGLMVHSLNVVQNLKKLSDALCPGKFDNPTLGFVGLFHDFGKVGDGKEPMYLPNDSDWHIRRGILYKINDKCSFMPTSERGLFIFQQQGIELSRDEYLAIRLNDGPYARENEPYKMNEPDLALITHWADRWSCTQEKHSDE